MLFIVLLLLLAVVSILQWHLVQATPRVLARILPRKLTFGIGLGFFALAIFSAYLAATVLEEPATVLFCFVQGYVGLWFMLATTATARGSQEDDEFLRRLFALVTVVFVAIIASLYAETGQVLSLINLLMITIGFWVTTNYLQHLDRGRR